MNPNTGTKIPMFSERSERTRFNGETIIYTGINEIKDSVINRNSSEGQAIYYLIQNYEISSQNMRTIHQILHL